MIFFTFPYKFTRTVNKQRVVVGLKQERILKLKQYLEESDKGQGAVYLVGKDTHVTRDMEIAEEPNDQEPSLPSTSKDNEQVPLVMKAKISRQPSLMDMYSPNCLTVSSNEKIDDECHAEMLKKFQLSMKTLAKNLHQALTRARQEYIDNGKSERKVASAKVEELENNLESQLMEMGFVKHRMLWGKH